jgi:hypothetical protein
MQASKVGWPASTVSWGSPGTIFAVLAKLDAGPFVPHKAPVVRARPVVRTIPLSNNVGIDVVLKIPFAIAGHVRVGLIIVTPGPTSLLASAVAVALGVTKSCAFAFGNKQADSNRMQKDK